MTTSVAPFLTSAGKDTKAYGELVGERLRTIRLRGELSQWLVLPASTLSAFNHAGPVLVGDDVSDALGVVRWERPVPASLSGEARGAFPQFLRKTDQERVRSMLRSLQSRDPSEVFECTLKFDGSSVTFYHYNGDVGVCSRNLDLKTDVGSACNTYVQHYTRLDIGERLKATGRNLAVQGELWGLGINGNWEGTTDTRFSVFDIFDCDRRSYVNADERKIILEGLGTSCDSGLKHVPILGTGALESFGLDRKSINSFLVFADRPSIRNKVAEGVVFKSAPDPDFSFKVLNTNYLLGGGE